MISYIIFLREDLDEKLIEKLMKGRFVIHIKAGAYFEYLDIPRSKSMLMLVGDGMDKTYIKGNRSVGDGWTTFRSATVGEFPSTSFSLS